MNRIILLLIILLQIFSFELSAQDLSKLSPMQLKGLGKNAIMYKDYYSAIDYYQAYLKKKKENATIMFQLAECYRMVREYEKAHDWYKKAFKKDGKNQLAAQYYQATMLMTRKQYTEAYDMLKQFKSSAKNNSKTKDLAKLAQIQMEGCRAAMKDSGNVLWISEVDTSINRNSIELSPFFLDENTMVFASVHTDKTTQTFSVDSLQNAPVKQFYLGVRNDKTWKYKSAWVRMPFNKPGINTANGAFSPDGKRFYFTRCERNWKNNIICAIYQSTKHPTGDWSEPVALPEIINNPKYTSTHPAVATFSKRDDEILYFVSDRKDGKGGLDIWYSQYRKKKDEWTEPKNCGNKINTSGNEITPYVDMENRVMYFSSDAMAGWGQFDIYKSTGEQSKWMPCENMRPPINSPFDDFYFNLSKNLSDGFIVTNRPQKISRKTQTCCDDIFSFKFDEVIRVKAIGTVYARIDKSFKKMLEDKFDDSQKKGKSQVDSSYEMAKGTVASLFIIDDTAPMGSGNMIYVKNDTIDENGNYSFNLEAGKEYVIEIENYGLYQPRLNISTFMYTKSDTMYLDTLGIDIMPKQPLIVKNVYYEFGESELTLKAKRSIDSSLLALLNENTQIIIEISSHTDNKGRDKLNKELSQARADKVVNYLVKKGISRERLYAVGYGEEQPIEPNETPNGEDNPTGREKNRRTEFKIIGSLNQYSEIIYEE